MSGYNIITDSSGITPALTIADWAKHYGENNIEYKMDQSMLTLCTPDDSLAFVGPPRLTGMGMDINNNTGTFSTDDQRFRIIGFMNNLTYSESAQIQPLKAIGSRRHFFSKSNMVVQGSIARIVLLGTNLFRLLYGVTEDSWMDDTTKYRHGNFDDGENLTYHNLEEDIYRIPFGLGIIYSAPGLNAASGFDALANGVAISAEYIECCVLQSRRISLTTGQGMVLEDVSFLGDRILPLPAFSAEAVGVTNTNPLASLVV